MLPIVAICTWNRAFLLRQTLDSLLTQPWRKTGASLLVVDNASTDETPSVLEAYRDRLPIRWVREMTPGHSHARNRALDEAGDATHLLFTDDDVIVSDAWLTAFARGIARFPEAAVFGGPVDPWFVQEPDPDLMSVFPALRMGFCGVDHPGADGRIESGEVFGANMGFRLAALKGRRFDTNLGHRHGRLLAGEEVAMIGALRAAGAIVVWIPDMRLRHYVDPSRMTQAYLVRHSEDYARGLVRIHGIPDGARIAGVPRWVIRRLVERRLAYHAYSLIGRRPEALAALREASMSLGTLKESYALSHQPSHENEQ